MVRLSLGATPGTLHVEGLVGQRGAAPALQPGTTLTLRPEQAGDGRLVARLGRLSLPLPQALGASAGTPLQVRVTGTAERPLLEIITPQGGGSRPGPEQAAQRQYLPRQAPVAQTFATLNTALTTAAERPGTASPAQAGESALPPAVSRLLGEVVRLIPASQRLASPEGLRTALRDSGVFFEPSLALAPQRAPEIAGRDLKAALARLAAQVRQSTAEAATRTASAQPATRLADVGQAAEGALARLALLQLTNSNAPDTRVDLSFELPVAHGAGVDELALRIREENEAGGGEAAASDDDERWELALRFRFTDVGRLDARLRLAGDRIGVTWWSESDALAAGVEAALPELERRLEAVGLTVGEIRAQRGSPPTDPISEPSGGGLLDERA